MESRYEVMKLSPSHPTAPLEALHTKPTLPSQVPESWHELDSFCTPHPVQRRSNPAWQIHVWNLYTGWKWSNVTHLSAVTVTTQVSDRSFIVSDHYAWEHLPLDRKCSHTWRGNNYLPANVQKKEISLLAIADGTQQNHRLIFGLKTGTAPRKWSFCCRAFRSISLILFSLFFFFK